MNIRSTYRNAVCNMIFWGQEDLYNSNTTRMQIKALILIFICGLGLICSEAVESAFNRDNSPHGGRIIL
jgi:hypothetical protein